MFRLAAMLYSLIATALSGSAVIAVLSAGMVSVSAIVGAAAAGAVIAAPASWMVARRLYQGA
ncbi:MULTISPECIES: hypothetical protein [Ruegeria]|uniref:CTP synthetase n=1 Tax=Ruegeria atlantica TaxID=81569 RepID=A0AA91BRT7_9RHOB|nr:MULTISPECIES: hypothetical protein [Ruegeria]NOC46372.1 hypothetical protein [Ruegeria sp. HKCCD7559]NOC84232.1 hypothetical protein [Ruegeria sp. HKCCD6428]NOC94456.1 hypothetical protein [Ruegeria sp. HKCCD6604]NOE18912.1 hypothetical protein [Ruegeria atlantica]NOE27238.1 hypothetical protein [Ruegeria sp. HKCCD6157]